MPNNSEIITFHSNIETIVKVHGVTYMDAIIKYAEDNDIEIELVASLVTGPLKSKLKEEAENLHMVKKSKSIKKLPI